MMEKRVKLLGKRAKAKKAQAYTLKLVLVVGIFVVAIILLYNILRPYLAEELEDPWQENQGKLAAVKPSGGVGDSDTKSVESGEGCVNVGSAEECDDGNECTSDICSKKKLCEYAERADGSVCNLTETGEGVCKDGECVLGS